MKKLPKLIMGSFGGHNIFPGTYRSLP